eukprot:1957993-Pyramimonas_sp.AAC.1
MESGFGLLHAWRDMEDARGFLGEREGDGRVIEDMPSRRSCAGPTPRSCVGRSWTGSRHRRGAGSTTG